MAREARKIAVIGAGNVGATCAFVMAERKSGEIVLLDIYEGFAKGKALDMSQGGQVLNYDGKITGTSNYEDIAGSDVVVVTSGFPRQPGMSREDLIGKNAEIISKLPSIENTLLVRYIDDQASLKENNSIFAFDEIADQEVTPELIFESVRKTGKVIVVDESNPKCSLASEITSLIAEKCFDDLKAAVIKITAPHTPVPFSPPMEDFYIPSTEKITQAIKKLYHG